MKLYKLIIFDLKNGIWAKKTVYLAVVAIGLLVFLDFSAHYHACYGENVFSGNLTLADCLLYCFSGRRPHSLDERIFLLPIVYFLPFLVSALLTLNYPMENLRGRYGIQVFIRIRNRRWWWFAKEVYVVISTCFSFCLFYLTLFLLSLLVGLSCTLCFSNEVLLNLQDYVFMTDPSTFELVIQLFFLPPLTAAVFNLFQLFLSLYMNRLGAFAIVVAVLLVSTYVQNPLLLGVYTMVIRSIWVDGGKAVQTTGVLLSLVYMAILTLAGWQRMRRFDIM